MGTGTSIFLIAVGAILRWGVADSVEGADLATIGLILLIVGVLGLILSLFFWNSWGGFGRAGSTTRRTRSADGHVYEEREERVETF